MPNRLTKARRAALPERRAARPEPAQSAQFYRQLAETIPHMAWAALPDGSTDFVNARVCEYTGRTHRQLIDSGWRAVVHPDDWERCRALWTKAFKKGQPYELEYRIRRRDGRYLWHLGSAMPLREGGRIVRWFGTSTDIENQKRAERLLEKARQALGTVVGARAEQLKSLDSRVRSWVENAPLMVWQSGVDKQCTYVNRPWLDFTGRDVKDELGVGWASRIHPDDLQRCLATYHAAFDAREPFEIEYRLLRHDGEYRWLVDRGVPVNDSERGFRGYIGSCVDVTERRATQFQQHDQQSRLRAFLDSMPAIAWIKDSRLRYLWISTSYARVHGKALGEMLGRDDFQIWPGPLAQHFRRDDEKALRANGPVQSVDTVPNPDGSKIRWMVVKFPVPDSTGALGVAGIGFDIATREHKFDGTGRLPEFPLDRLSARERQVLRLIVDGRTSAEVAGTLGLSPKSVDTYRSRLMAKLDIEDLPGLVKFALRHGLTTTR